MFDEVAPHVDLPALEREILQLWETTRAFETLVARNRGRARWSLLDGPITPDRAAGLESAWGRTYRDLFQRFRAMRGYDQRYLAVFDGQGPWVEVEAEQELGLRSRHDVDVSSMERFAQACRTRAHRFAAAQARQSIRLGYWMDWPHSSSTMEDEHHYTVWLFLKRCHERGLIYRGRDVVPWCPRCSTGVARHEIVSRAGQEPAAPMSVLVRLPLLDQPDESLLAWTAAPWTLPANVAGSAHPDLAYAKVRTDGGVLYLARDALASLPNGPPEILEELAGAQLAGRRYRGPFDDLPAVQRSGALEAHRILLEAGEATAEGTGIALIAPGCSRTDYRLGRAQGLPVLAPLDDGGRYIDGFGPLSGRNAHEAAPLIAQLLAEKGLLVQAAPSRHRAPACPYCGTPLVFRLSDEWFLSMEGPMDRPMEGPKDSAPVRRSQGLAARAHDVAEVPGEAEGAPAAGERPSGDQAPRPLREQIMALARKIRWIPAWGLERELDWLRRRDDWLISRKNRRWGLALPIWTCASCGWWDVIGSDDELRQRAVAGWEAFAGHSPHRPWIDAVRLRCPACGELASRIPDGGDPWLDAGAIPYAMLDYRRNRAHWAEWFPLDLVSECVPRQLHTWFSALLAVSTVLENRPPFRTVLGYQQVRDERPASQGHGAGFECDELMEQVGASTMRWLFAGANPGRTLRIDDARCRKARRTLLALWNVCAFFCRYARLARFDPTTVWIDPAQRPALDRWLLSELHALIRDVTNGYEAFDAMAATRRLEQLIADLSRWYLRRSRDRFRNGVAGGLSAAAGRHKEGEAGAAAPAPGRSEAVAQAALVHSQDGDAEPAAADTLAAYLTLWETLATLARLLAPSQPFLAEAIYQRLVRPVDTAAPVSVHHCPWPAANPALIDPSLREAMALARRIVRLGRAARAKAGIKVRQPLAALLVRVRSAREQEALQSLGAEVCAELNVQRLELVRDASRIVSYRVRPDLRLLGAHFGANAGDVARALERAGTAELARRHASGEPVTLIVRGLEIEVPADEYEVEIVDAEGYAAVQEHGLIVALDVRLTPELIQAGWVREIIHGISRLRRAAGLSLEEPVAIAYQAEEPVAGTIDRFAGRICRRTRAQRLVHAPTPAGSDRQTLRLGSHTIVLGLERLPLAPADAPGGTSLPA